MSAICGVLDLGSGLDVAAICGSMMRSLAVYGPHRQSTIRRLPTAFGRALHDLLPEDRFDRQPLTGGDGRFLVAADLRIDNRAELGSKLALSTSRMATLSDADVLLSGVERWGEDVVDHLVGDYAFALWDAAAHRLVLARDPFGQRPLYFHAGAGFFAFASRPQALHALDGVPVAADPARVAGYMAGLAPRDGQSYFAGIRSVEPGQMVVLADGALAKRIHWNPRPAELRLRGMADYVEAFREQLDRAVESRLRGHDGAVAAHLSAGYDSGAVAATAARLMSGGGGGRVLAMTAAPRRGYDGPVPRGRVADESPIAARTAALHPGMEHVVVRPSGRPAGGSVLARLPEAVRLAGQPIGHVCNNSWWDAINEAAAARGVRIMLTGEKGNLSISAGTLLQLADMVRTGDWRSWLRESRALVAGGTVRPRGVLASSFGPWMPRRLWLRLGHAFLGTSLHADAPPLLTARWTAAMAEALGGSGTGTGLDGRPPRDSRAFRVDALRRQDQGDYRKVALARWGIDERDPTADRRLVEFCLSLPIDMLLRDGETRPLAKRALADRLPDDVLYGRLRGCQMADWFEQITGSDARESFDAVAHSAAAAAVIDMDALRSKIDAWPKTGWETPAVVGGYRGDVLHALSAAHFLHQTEVDAGSATMTVG